MSSSFKLFRLPFYNILIWSYINKMNIPGGWWFWSETLTLFPSRLVELIQHFLFLISDFQHPQYFSLIIRWINNNICSSGTMVTLFAMILLNGGGGWMGFMTLSHSIYSVSWQQQIWRQLLPLVAVMTSLCHQIQHRNNCGRVCSNHTTAKCSFTLKVMKYISLFKSTK